MIKERKTELVEGFRHSVPYINTHRGKTFVIMLGGEALSMTIFPASLAISGYCIASVFALSWCMARDRKSTPIWPRIIMNRFTTKTRG